MGPQSSVSAAPSSTNHVLISHHGLLLGHGMFFLCWIFALMNLLQYVYVNIKTDDFLLQRDIKRRNASCGGNTSVSYLGDRKKAQELRSLPGVALTTLWRVDLNTPFDHVCNKSPVQKMHQWQTNVKFCRCGAESSQLDLQALVT